MKRVEEETKTKGGIIIPDTAKEKAAGRRSRPPSAPARRNDKGDVVALDVKAGDRILFGKWSGTEVKVDGQDLLIMKESDVLGVVEGPKALSAPEFLPPKSLE
ncbi:co-chaperone GroES [Caulobacter segnis]